MKRDARLIPPAAQEELRKRAVEAVLEGKPQYEVADVIGVSPSVICRWVQKFRQGGLEALVSQKRGRRLGSGRILTERQAHTIRELIKSKRPEQLELPLALWTRDAVADLVFRRFSIRVPCRTMGNYLREWGFTPQKPIRRAYERNPEAVELWLNETYPAIVRRAKAEKAVIYWGDEMGLRSDHHVGRSYSVRGTTPVTQATGKRFRCSMVSAMSNLGHLRFIVFEGNFNADLFIEFLGRLIKGARKKVFLIVDGLSVHHAKPVKEWCASHSDRIELFYLPAYSPDLNPSEILNQDVKSNVSRQGTYRSLAEMKRRLTDYLTSTALARNIVRRFFREKHVRYALA